jgi:hypothetical protein
MLGASAPLAVSVACCHGPRSSNDGQPPRPLQPSPSFLPWVAIFRFLPRQTFHELRSLKNSFQHLFFLDFELMFLFLI